MSIETLMRIEAASGDLIVIDHFDDMTRIPVIDIGLDIIYVFSCSRYSEPFRTGADANFYNSCNPLSYAEPIIEEQNSIEGYFRWKDPFILDNDYKLLRLDINDGFVIVQEGLHNKYKPYERTKELNVVIRNLKEVVDLSGSGRSIGYTFDSSELFITEINNSTSQDDIITQLLTSNQ